MWNIHAIATIGTIIVTVIVSLRGFKDYGFRERLIFNPYPILAHKEYHRLITPALLHLDPGHLFGNMLTLFLFGSGVEEIHGSTGFILIYLGSIIGGNLLSLWMHRNHEYRALGASGGACGILFAWILFFPEGNVMLFLIPIPIPGFLYALGYLVYSFLAMKRGIGNIGHDAHIGGSIVGLLIAAMFNPHSVTTNPWLFATLAILAALMCLYLWKNPLMLPLKHFTPIRIAPSRKTKPQSDSQPTTEKVDAILEKVSKRGIHRLNQKEREILEKASNQRR